MMDKKLEDLFLEALEAENTNGVLPEILSLLSAHGNLSDPEIKANIDILIESMGSSIETSKEKALFCRGLAEIFPSDSSVLRNALDKSLKALLPKGVPKSLAVKVLGTRDQSVPIAKIARLLKKLIKFKVGLIVYSENSKKWGVISNFDEFTGEYEVREPAGKKAIKMSLSEALSSLHLFDGGKETLEFISPVEKPDIAYSKWSVEFRKKSLVDITDELVEEIALNIFVPAIMKAEDFKKWVSGVERGAQAGDIRKIDSARNIKELHLILSGYGIRNADFNINSSSLEYVSSLMKKTPVVPGDQVMLAECVAVLSSYLDDSLILKTFSILKNRGSDISIWPENPGISSPDIEIWNSIQSQYLPLLVHATSVLFSNEYLAKLCLSLPFRCWTSIVNETGMDLLGKAVESAPVCLTSDAIIWIWRARKNKAVSLSGELNLKNVLSAIAPLSFEDIRCRNSVKDLKNMFLNDAGFQEFLMGKSDLEKISQFLDDLRTSHSLSLEEKQILIVKLSRFSETLKEIIEKGRGRGIFSSAPASNSGTEVKVTSSLSYKIKMKELEDIINRQIPENTAAIAHARGYGDLRENAEYSAAKERQRFLMKRRHDLELEISNTVPSDFTNMTVSDSAVIGSSITISSEADKQSETYHIMGVWDSDPSRKILSCDSGLAGIFIGRKINETVSLPDGKNAKILEIKPLPEELRREYADEKESVQ